MYVKNSKRNRKEGHEGRQKVRGEGKTEHGQEKEKHVDRRERASHASKWYKDKNCSVNMKK